MNLCLPSGFHRRPEIIGLNGYRRDWLVKIASYIQEYDGFAECALADVRRAQHIACDLPVLEAQFATWIRQGFFTREADGVGLGLGPLLRQDEESELSADALRQRRRRERMRANGNGHGLERDSGVTFVTESHGLERDEQRDTDRDSHVRASAAAAAESSCDHKERSAAAAADARDDQPAPPSADIVATVRDALMERGVNGDKAAVYPVLHLEECIRQLELTDQLPEDAFDRGRGAYLSKAIPGAYGPLRWPKGRDSPAREAARIYAARKGETLP